MALSLKRTWEASVGLRAVVAGAILTTVTGSSLRLCRRDVLRAAGLIGIGVGGLAGCADSPWPDDAGGQLRIATGNRGAVFDTYGRALGEEAASVMPDLRPETIITGGSFANLGAISAGRAEVAFTLGDSADLALDGAPPFDRPVELTALTRLYDSFLQVLVPRDSVIQAVGDLRGRTITAGEPDSGTRVVTKRCLVAAGVNEQDVDILDLPLLEATTALERGETDALAFVSGFPMPALVDLGERFSLRALELGGLVGDLAGQWGNQYVPGLLPADPYRLPAPVETISVKTYLVASPALAEPVAYGFTAVILDRQAQIADRVPRVRQPTPLAAIYTQRVPLHAGATRFFRELDRRDA